MRSSRQAAHIIVRIPTDQLSHLGDCFTSRERKGVGAKTRPWALDLCAQSHNQGNSGHASFLPRYHFGPKDPPSALHFCTLHRGDPRGQGMVSYKAALYFQSKFSPARGWVSRKRKDCKLDSLAVLRSLQFPFKETSHFSQNWGKKTSSILTSSWEGRIHSQ